MSAATVIATIDSAKVAQQLIDELLKAGFKDQDVEILDGDEDELVAEIEERGFGKDDARGYAIAANRGKSLVAARAPDKVERVAAIMERYETSGGESSQQEQGETVQEIEEELAVGKRKVVSGGARVTTSVSERPVEETVTLREEQVEVEHQPADRKLKPEEAEAAFQEKTVEMLGTSEELEVSKEARVIGEVALGKRVAEHEETVKDTVRRSKVEIEKIKPSAGKSK
ncbi:MAG: YsnF/AvaK domain-containing protein [Hyphomicrobiaceae bacterium]